MKKQGYNEIVEMYSLQNFINHEVVLIRSENKDVSSVILYIPHLHNLHFLAGESPLANLENAVRILNKKDAYVFSKNRRIKEDVVLKGDNPTYLIEMAGELDRTYFLEVGVEEVETNKYKLSVRNAGAAPARGFNKTVVSGFETEQELDNYYKKLKEDIKHGYNNIANRAFKAKRIKKDNENIVEKDFEREM